MAGRGPSPRRERSRRRQDTKRGLPAEKQARPAERRQPERKDGGEVDARVSPEEIPSEAKSRVQHQLNSHGDWSAMWLDGIDPPRRPATTPNVTMLIISNAKLKIGEEEQDYGFVLAHSRVGAKKKDREKECSTDMFTQLNVLPMDDAKAWCRLPPPDSKKQVEAADMEKLKEVIESRCPKTIVELPEPMVCVLVDTMGFNQLEKPTAPDADVTVLDRFDNGFVDLFREAKRVSGLVRKQWYLASVNVRREGVVHPFGLGYGLATDRELARVRAVHSAGLRAELLTEEVLAKLVGQSEPPSS